MNINSIKGNWKVSYNAICQAVKRLVPHIGYEAHREICGYPACFTANNRYWRETYNIKAWDDRSAEERRNAISVARDILGEAMKRGVTSKALDKMLKSGKVRIPTEWEIQLAGYKSHHTATRQGYCPVDSVGAIETYTGRFGRGFIQCLGRGGVMGNSTQYEAIRYWVR